jgi:hypothetical protein
MPYCSYLHNVKETKTFDSVVIQEQKGGVTVAIMIEEAGEAMQAAINCHYEGGDIELLRIELAQVGAMAIRAIIHL